jgi:hypothetical protein
VTALFLAHCVYEVEVVGVEKRGWYVKWSKEQLFMIAFKEVTMLEAAWNGVCRVQIVALRPSPLSSEISSPSVTLHMHVMLWQLLKI